MSQFTVTVLPFEASAAITKARLVKQTGNQTVAPCAASTDRPIGVAQLDISASEATAGKGTGVMVLGVAWTEAGAAVALGARVMSDASGRAITAATATNIPCGVAMKAAGGAGELIPVLLTPGLPAL